MIELRKAVRRARIEQEATADALLTPILVEPHRGIERAVALGWLWRHESGTFLKFTEAGAELFV